MAAKLDKEMLAKNQFWIGLGVFVLLFLILLIVVLTSGDSNPQKTWSETKKKIDAYKGKKPKTAKYQEPWNEYGKKFREHKDKVWQAAWSQQADMYDWPDGMAIKPQFPEQLFGRTTNEDLNERSKFRTDLYPRQFDTLASVVAPVEFNGKFEDVFPPQKWDKSRAPTREEIWLAQEDFWVRREVLNTVALFKKVDFDPKEKLPEGIVGRRLFRNANWELNLLFEKDKDGRRLLISDKSTIKNINASGRTLALANPRTHGPLLFYLWQKGRSPMEVAGEPLPAGQQTTLKKSYDPGPVNLKDEFYVEQVLEWELSPVRRIDALEIARHSHRTITAGLKIREDLKKLDPEPTEPAEGAAGGAAGAAGATGVPATSGVPAGGSGMAPPGGRMGGSGGPGASGSEQGGPPADATRINQISRARYMHVKEQARHLPIAMRLIVDQAYINDVLAVIANSRLRIQITQVTMHQATNVARTGGQTTTGTTGTTPPTSSQQYGPGMYAGMRPPPGMSGYRPGMMGGSGVGRPRPGPGVPGPGRPTSPLGPAPTPQGPVEGREKPDESSAQVQDTARLLEVSVYGVATLYERFRKKPETAPTTPTTPTPAVGAIPTPGQPKR